MSDLTVTGVTLAYENTNIIEDINIELHDNELVCLLGASGGGKTTLFNVISGLKKPDQGKVMLDGRDITGQPGNISYMLQKDLLLPYRTIEDNVALPLLIKGENKKSCPSKSRGTFSGVWPRRHSEKVSETAFGRYAPEGCASEDLYVF